MIKTTVCVCSVSFEYQYHLLYISPKNILRLLRTHGLAHAEDYITHPHKLKYG